MPALAPRASEPCSALPSRLHNAVPRCSTHLGWGRSGMYRATCGGAAEAERLRGHWERCSARCAPSTSSRTLRLAYPWPCPRCRPKTAQLPLLRVPGLGRKQTWRSLGWRGCEGRRGMQMQAPESEQQQERHSASVCALIAAAVPGLTCPRGRARAGQPRPPSWERWAAALERAATGTSFHPLRAGLPEQVLHAEAVFRLHLSPHSNRKRALLAVAQPREYDVAGICLQDQRWSGAR